MSKLRQDLHIGHNLRKLRMQNKYTQEQIVAKLQLSGSQTTRSVYSRYESGLLNVKISDLVCLKQVYQCSFDDFFEGLESLLSRDN